jgi:hypothetical protein
MPGLCFGVAVAVAVAPIIPIGARDGNGVTVGVAVPRGVGDSSAGGDEATIAGVRVRCGVAEGAVGVAATRPGIRVRCGVAVGVRVGSGFGDGDVRCNAGTTPREKPGDTAGVGIGNRARGGEALGLGVGVTVAANNSPGASRLKHRDSRKVRRIRILPKCAERRL